ncbi:13556_t:CDS:2, partial [Gigaspora rosea]
VGSPFDWKNLDQAFKLYEAASNSKINKNKTKLVPLSMNARSIELKGELQNEKADKQETIKVLGFDLQIDDPGDQKNEKLTGVLWKKKPIL